ncbi:hypothetical protein BC628DRAFT_1318519 [Trametes gibbosa]|nr:hypothetical protein BC628DRAFT_1318519 [Trametes gibbosa]
MNSRAVLALRSPIQNSIRRTLRCSHSYSTSALAARLSSPTRTPARSTHIRIRTLQSNSVRACSAAPTREYSTGSNAPPPASTLPDPDRPDLFYHLYHAPNAISARDPIFAVAFLSDPPPSVLSAVVIGWLPASGAGEEAGLNDFVENEQFRVLLHRAIQGALTDGADEVQANGAIQLGEGWMHIHDGRNVPALGRIGDPDDIIASVRVEHGKIMADTYQPMPSYRLCTSDGVLQLTEGLAARLVEVLQEAARGETKPHNST